jgi:hypothetical protein
MCHTTGFVKQSIKFVHLSNTGKAETDFVHCSSDFIYTLNGESEFAEAPPQVLWGNEKMKLENNGI